jgi:trimeric autotransporter adhesin
MSSVHISQPMLIRVAILFAVMTIAVIGVGETHAIAPQTYTVTTTTDDPALATCDLAGSGPCSLRAAIIAANAHPSDAGPDVIQFKIPPYAIQTIELSATYGELPVLTGPTLVDGTTQPEDVSTPSCIDVRKLQCIRLDGSHTSGGGLFANSTGITIQGMAIYSFEHAAMIGVFSAADGTVIRRNDLGMPDGESTVPNSYEGVFVEGGATGVVIGGDDAADRNIIAGNLQSGVRIVGDGNVVKGNYIGIGHDGLQALPNNVGVLVQGNDNQIGVPGHGNLISGNGVDTFTSGVWVQTGMNNTIAGNYIGTNAAGDGAVPNGYGIHVNMAAAGTIIGGSTAPARNVISGNAYNGVRLEDDVNTIVKGNYIGPNAGGTAGLTDLYGVLSTNSSGLLIGGTAAGDRNVISGNGPAGIIFTSGNVDHPAAVQGNYIGLNPGGTSAIPNTGSGITIGLGAHGAEFNQFEISHNVVSGNGANGIFIAPTTGSSVSNTRIHFNTIGLDAAGHNAVPNSGSGILLTSAIGGDVSNNDIGDRFNGGVTNVISGNRGDGVELVGNRTYFNEILDALIGTNAAGSSAIGNGGVGVHIHAGAEQTDIDSSTIVGNSVGIDIADGSTRNEIGGNYIGTNAALKAGLGNTGFGIHVFGAGTDIGSTSFGNVIRNNGAAGVDVQGLTSLRNHISENSINNNAGLGIDLVDGANANQAAPALALADSTSGTDTHIVGTLTSTASTAFHIEFFASPTCDLLGTGEGRDFLGSGSATTSHGGVATINSTVPSATGGKSITATATDPDGNTSEFSNCVTASGPEFTPTPTPTPGLAGDADCDGDVDIDDVLAALEDAADVEEAPCHGLTDVDCDGDVDGNDALQILLFAGGTKPAPAGCVQ